MRRPQAFISYKREDEPFARRLHEFLMEQGFNPWLDVLDIPKGIDPNTDISGWDDAIDKGLKSSDIVIGVMSPEAVASPNVRNEWAWALSAKKALILVRLRPVSAKDMPHRFGRISYIDFSRNKELGFRSLKEQLRTPQPLPETFDERTRRTLLDRVYKFWIEDVLDKSLFNEVLIQLGIDKRANAVEHPWEIVRSSAGETKALTPGTKIFDVFEDSLESLLILGEPGSGKTITLLELARDAIHAAQPNPGRPIPVVLNLSSWATEQSALLDWLADELHTKYQLSAKIARRMVEQEDVLLLLDGLDEVRVDAREACVAAINSHLAEQGNVSIVVCSRIDEYQSLNNKLKLSDAVQLRPLSTPQIQSYFSRAGVQLGGLQSALETSAALRQLAQSPFWLNTMCLAYQGASAAAILEDKPETNTFKILFHRYIQAAFQRRSRVQSHFVKMPSGISKQQRDELSKEEEDKTQRWLA